MLASAGGKPWRALAAHTLTLVKVRGFLFSTLHFLIPLSLISKKCCKYHIMVHNLYSKHATLLLSAYCTSSSLCHFLLTKFTFFTLLPLLPIWVPIWRCPFLCVNIAGILSPMAQQLLSVEVRRSSSAIPLLRLLPAKEWMYKSKVSLNVGPQVGSVANRLLFPTGNPSTIITFELCERLIVPQYRLARLSKNYCNTRQKFQTGEDPPPTSP